MVTSAHGTPARRRSSSSSRAPGRQGTSCRTLATTPSSSRSTISCGVRSMPMWRRMNRPEVIRSLPTSCSASSRLQVPPYSAARANSVSIQYGSVSTRVPSMSQSTAAGMVAGALGADVSVVVWSPTTEKAPSQLPLVTKRQADGLPRCSVLRVVPQVRRHPPLGLGQGPPFALGVVGDLVAAEPADHEVLRLRVGEVPARHRRARPHRHRLGELDAGGRLDVPEAPESLLLGVLGAGRVAGGGGGGAGLFRGQVLVWGGP